MNSKLQLITVKELLHFQSLGRHSLFKQTVAQFRRQHFYLDTLRIRHIDVINTFIKIIDNAAIHRFELEHWLISSKDLLSQAFGKIVKEGDSWKGSGMTEKALIQPLNEICKHTLHAMLSLDLLTSNASEVGLHATNLALNPFMERVVDEVSGFSKEKFGVCPEFQIRGDLDILAVRPFLEFATVEIIKNSIKAVVDRYGALNLDDSPPIVIHLHRNTSGNKTGQIIFSDNGTGMQKDVADRCFDAFYSTSAASREDRPNNQYSRDFGAPFTGAGIGLLKTKVYLDFHRAEITLKTKPNEGTIFSIEFH